MLLSLILLLSYSISTQGVIINGRQCQCTCTDPEHPVQKVYTNGNLKVKANSQNSINVKTDDITTSSQKLPKEKLKLTKGKQKMSTGIKRDKIISVSKDLTSHVKGDKTSGAVKYNKNINSKSNISVHANTNGQRTSEYIQIGPTYGAEDNYTMLGHGYIVPLNDKTIVIANSKNQENKKIGKTISENGKETIQKLNSVWDVLGKEQIQKKKPNIDNTVWNKLSTAPTNNNNNNNGNFPGNNQPFNNRQSNNNINQNKNMGMQRNNMNGNNNNNNNQWQTQSRNNGNNNNPNNGNINNNNPWKNGNNNNNQQWNPNNNNNNQQWNPNNNNQQWNPNNNNNQQWNPNNNNQQWNPNNNNQQWNPNNNNKNNNNNNNQQWNGNNNIDQPQNQNNNNDQQWNRNNNQNQLLNPIDNKNDIIKLWSKMRTLLRSKQQSMSQALSWRTRQNGRSFPNKLSRNQRRMRKKVGTTMSPQDMAEEMFGTSEVDPIILEILSKSNQKQFNL